MIIYPVVLVLLYVLYTAVRTKKKMSATWNALFAVVAAFVLLFQLGAFVDRHTIYISPSDSALREGDVIDLRFSDPIEPDYDVPRYTLNETEQSEINPRGGLKRVSSGGLKRVSSGGPKRVKVLLVTYMRSGSSFLGSMLQENSESQYWFEPIDGVYMHLYGSGRGLLPLDITHYLNGSLRELPDFERQYLADSIVNLFHCECDALPHETLLHGFTLKFMRTEAYRTCTRQAAMRAYRALAANPRWLEGPKGELAAQAQCPINDNNKFTRCRQWLTDENTKNNQLEKYRQHRRILQTTWESCGKILKTRCNTSRIHVAKTIRITMDTVRDVMALDPDVKVVHLLRDPRGIVHSRISTSTQLLSRAAIYGITNTTQTLTPQSLKTALNRHTVLVHEARLLCERMTRDFEIVTQLKELYPNQFLELKYENIAIDPLEHYRVLYDFLGLEHSESVARFIYQSTHADKNGKIWSVVRSNSTATAFKWKSAMAQNTKESIARVCDGVLKHMYPDQ